MKFFISALVLLDVAIFSNSAPIDSVKNPNTRTLGDGLSANQGPGDFYKGMESAFGTAKAMGPDRIVDKAGKGCSGARVDCQYNPISSFPSFGKNNQGSQPRKDERRRPHRQNHQYEDYDENEQYDDSEGNNYEVSKNHQVYTNPEDHKEYGDY